jgi:hypothetical protein
MRTQAPVRGAGGAIRGEVAPTVPAAAARPTDIPVTPAPAARKHTVEELLEAGGYDAPGQVSPVPGMGARATPDDIRFEIARQGQLSQRLSGLEIEAHDSYLRHGEFMLEGTGDAEIRAVMRGSSRYVPATLSQPPFSFDEVVFAIREEKGRIEKRIQELQKLGNEDLAAREAAMQRGIERIGLEEAPSVPRGALRGEVARQIPTRPNDLSGSTSTMVDFLRSRQPNIESA